MAHLNAADPGTRHTTVVAGTTVLPGHRALYIAVTGDVTIVDENDVSIQYVGVPVGLFPFAAKKITAATATVVMWS
jgi:hypothetical protein